MPNTKSAKKRLRQNLERRARNRSGRSALRSLVRKVREEVKAGNATQAEADLKAVQKKLDKAGASRLIHPNAAARTKSRLSARVKAIKKGS